MAFDLADVVPLTVTIRDADGAAADGGAVVLTVGLPDGTAATPPVTHAGTGVYQVDYQPTMPGRHTVQWVCTGLNASGYSDVFDVRPANPGYIISLADAKQQLNKTDTRDDEELRLFIEGTTWAIEDYLGRAVIRRTFTEQLTAACGEVMLSWTPVASLTSVATTDGLTSWNVADLYVSKSGILTAKAGVTGLFGELNVVYVAGDAVVRADWALGARFMIQNLWQNQRGTMGGPRPGGMELPGAGFTSMGYAIPIHVKQMLSGRLPGV